MTVKIVDDIVIADRNNIKKVSRKQMFTRHFFFAFFTNLNWHQS